MTFADGVLHCSRSCRCRRRHHRFFCHHHHHHSLSPPPPDHSRNGCTLQRSRHRTHAHTRKHARTARPCYMSFIYLTHTRCRVPSIIHTVGGAARGAFDFRSSALIPFWHRSFAHRCLVLSSTLAHRAFIFHHLLWVNRRCTNHVQSSSVPSRISVVRIFTRTHIHIHATGFPPPTRTFTHIPASAPYTLPLVWSLKRALWIRSLWHCPASSLAHSTCRSLYTGPLNTPIRTTRPPVDFPGRPSPRACFPSSSRPTPCSIVESVSFARSHLIRIL